jgi:3-dehydroquinate dehydratase
VQILVHDDPDRIGVRVVVLEGVICGLGVEGYLVALQAMAMMLRNSSPFAS